MEAEDVESISSETPSSTPWWPLGLCIVIAWLLGAAYGTNNTHYGGFMGAVTAWWHAHIAGFGYLSIIGSSLGIPLVSPSDPATGVALVGAAACTAIKTAGPVVQAVSFISTRIWTLLSPVLLYATERAAQ